MTPSSWPRCAECDHPLDARKVEPCERCGSRDRVHNETQRQNYSELRLADEGKSRRQPRYC